MLSGMFHGIPFTALQSQTSKKAAVRLCVLATPSFRCVFPIEDSSGGENETNRCVQLGHGAIDVYMCTGLVNTHLRNARPRGIITIVIINRKQICIVSSSVWPVTPITGLN